MRRMYLRVRAWWDGLADERGATAVEYALMLALIFLVVFAAVQLLGQETNEAYESVVFPP